MALFFTSYARLITPALILLAIFAQRPQAKDAEIRVAVTWDILADYQRFVGTRDVTQIDYYGGPGARRDVIELVLLQQALRLGGLQQPLTIVREQTYRRTLYQVAHGELISSGALVWKSDTHELQADLLLSSAVIKDGEFSVGLYTSETNYNALNANQSALRQLVAVTSPDWRTDIETLQALGFKQIYLANTWVSIVRMLQAGRGDVTLAPFQSGSDMTLHTDIGKLVPINNIKIALTGSRHWIISRVHPESTKYYTALEKGLQQLAQQGVILQAYRDCGFFNPAVKDWPLLQPIKQPQP